MTVDPSNTKPDRDALKAQMQTDLDDLCTAFMSLKTHDEMLRFLKDLTTPGERRALSERWAVARLLDEGKLSYRDISQHTGVSTTTVTRVARFLTQENYQGYQLALDRNKKAAS